MIKSILRKIVALPGLWPFLKPFAKLGMFIHNERLLVQGRMNREERMAKLIKAPIFQDRLVMNGPFKGMYYPKMQSIGSSLTPKLLGSYESELHEIIEEFCSQKYTDIIDIGCAEGYYAVGMAIRIPSAEVHAFDTDSKAREICKLMVEANKVKNRVFINKSCNDEILKNFKFRGKGLIISDCEGYEACLFNENNINQFKNCDLIIETHDFIDINISSRLKNLFSPTHNITSLFSTDDIQKAYNYNISQISNFVIEDRRELLAEERPCTMEWLICRAKI